MSSKGLKSKEYAGPPGSVNRSVEDDLQEFVQLFAQVVQTQKRVGGHPPQAFVDAFEQNKLGPRHIRVLMSLTLNDAQSVSELAYRIGLSLGTTSLMVGELSRAGLVDRSEDERDRRRTIVRLSHDQQKMMEALFRERTEPMRRALEKMEPSDRETFMEGWRLLADEASTAAEAEDTELC
jgi:DNA-binding MarR family transcriptional regulator